MTDPKNLEIWLHEKADPARAFSADRARYTLNELLAEASCQHPLPPSWPTPKPAATLLYRARLRSRGAG